MNNQQQLYFTLLAIISLVGALLTYRVEEDLLAGVLMVLGLFSSLLFTLEADKWRYREGNWPDPVIVWVLFLASLNLGAHFLFDEIKFLAVLSLVAFFGCLLIACFQYVYLRKSTEHRGA